MTLPPPAFYVAATTTEDPPARAWLLGPYRNRTAAESNRLRAVALAAKAAAPLVNVRVATAPAGIAIATKYGA